MPEQYYVRAVDAETGETTVKGPVPTLEAATDLADQWAAESLGGNGVTWIHRAHGERYELHVGELDGDGSRSGVLVTITVDRASAGA